jgi:hypothetical protein
MSANAVEKVKQEEKAATPITSPADAQENFQGPYETALPVGASDAVILHVRFRNDAEIWEIAERPEGLTKQEWFQLLCARAGEKYETRIGGRGFFRLTRLELDSIKSLKAQ